MVIQVHNVEKFSLNLNFLECEDTLNILFIRQELKLASPQYCLDLMETELTSLFNITKETEHS